MLTSLFQDFPQQEYAGLPNSPFPQSVESAVYPQGLTRVIPNDITIEKSSFFKPPTEIVGNGSSPKTAPMPVTVSSPLTPSAKSHLVTQDSDSSSNNGSGDAKPTLLSLAKKAQPQVVQSPLIQQTIYQQSSNEKAENESKNVSASNNAASNALPSNERETSSQQIDILDTISEASYSSEMELEKYSQASFATVSGIDTDYELESEAFLRSLPPIKPINLDIYASSPILPPVNVANLHEKIRQKPSTPHVDKQIKTDSITNGAVTESPLKDLNGVPTTFSEHSNPATSSFSTPTSSLPGKPIEVESSPLTGESSTSFVNFTSPANTTYFSSPHQNTQYLSALSDVSVFKTPVQSPANSSIVSKKRLDEVLKEKAKLQGQLEILTSESQNVLKVQQKCLFFFLSFFFFSI